MRFKKIINLFKSGNVCVTGLRGRGKDLLFGNVIIRRKEPYVSTIDYGGSFAPIDFKSINVGENTYKNFVSGDVKCYKFPYARGSDIYISDVGIYFPSQYNNELNKHFQHLPTYMALSRQVSHNNFHINVQNLNRAWDKIREQSDIYIRCKWCIYIPILKLVIQNVVIYDKYQSCVDRVEPCRVRVPLLNKEAKTQAQIYIDNFHNTHGSVKSRFLFYRNKSNYDTFFFEKLLENGKKED